METRSRGGTAPPNVSSSFRWGGNAQENADGERASRRKRE